MNIEEFKKAVEEGKIKNKWYFYKRSEDNRNALIRDMYSLISFIKDKFNLEVYLIYGTLLGAIREQNFIEHDNDVDLSYMSKQNNLKDVLYEFQGLCTILRNHEVLSKICSNGHLHVYSPNKRNKFDFWTSFIIENKYYLVPLIEGEISSEIILPLRTIDFKNMKFPIPNKPENCLDSIYSNWKHPDLINKGIISKWKKIL